MKKEIKKWVSGVFALLCVAYLAFLWCDSPNREVVWFMLAFGGLFRQIGGTYWKFVGRFLTPLLPAMAYFFFIGWSWWIPAIYGAYLIVKTLPVTLKGDSVLKPWYNLVWIWVLGFLNGIPALTLGISTNHIICALAMSIVPMVVYGTVITLSNIPATAKYFPWKLDEFCMGASALVPACMVIDHFLINPPM